MKVFNFNQSIVPIKIKNPLTYTVNMYID